MSFIVQDLANSICQEFPVPREEQCKRQYMASAGWRPQHGILCKSLSSRIKRIAITDAAEITIFSCSGFRFCENWSLNCLLWSFISAISFWGIIHKMKLHRTSEMGTAREKLLHFLVWIQSYFYKRNFILELLITLNKGTRQYKHSWVQDSTISHKHN